MTGITRKRLISDLVPNVIYSDAVLIITRILYSEFGFPTLTLRCFCCFAVSLGLVLCDKLKLFKPKSLPLLKLLPAVVIYSAFVALTDLSLQKNSVGTHLTLTVTSPLLVLVVQTLFHKQKLTRYDKLVTVAVSTGVLICNTDDTHFNPDIVYAVTGFSAMTAFQFWVCEYSSQLEASPVQIMFYLLPMSALLLLTVVPFVEPVGQIFDTMEALPGQVFLLVAILVVLHAVQDITTYRILKGTSPTSYGIFINFKVCTMSVLGLLVYVANTEYLNVIQGHTTFADVFEVLDKGPNIVSIFGLLIALSGIAIYLKRQINKNRAPDIPTFPTFNQVTSRKRIISQDRKTT